MRKIAKITVGAVVLSAVALWMVPEGCDRLAGNVPIRAYGRVVDQTGAPVPGAQVHVVVSRNYRYRLPLLWTGVPEEYRTIVTTDQAGDFVIKDVTGFALLLPVEKKGYEQYRWNRAQFLYNGAQDAHEPLPDRTHPATLLMWKLGERRILSGQVRLAVTSDGRLYEVDLPRAFYRTPPMLDEGDLNLGIRPDAGKGKWVLSVNAIEGALIETDEPEPRTAPPAGYLAQFSYPLGHGGEAAPGMERAFYMRRKAGLIYGWLMLKVHVGANGVAEVTIDYRLSHDKNPDLR